MSPNILDRALMMIIIIEMNDSDSVYGHLLLGKHRRSSELAVGTAVEDYLTSRRVTFTLRSSYFTATIALLWVLLSPRRPLN